MAPRQPKASASRCEVGKDTVPANPAISVTVVIAPLASTPSMWVRWAKQGSYRAAAISTPSPIHTR